MAKKKNADVWAEAKKRCILKAVDIQVARELGMSPKSLIKSIPSKSQQWKAPVKVWVGKLYEDKFGRGIDNKPALTEDKREKQWTLLQRLRIFQMRSCRFNE
jgi:hypothetical protein